ncbi:Ammonium transporter, putative [Oleispira antarctica RB-8]|uniref:Ammonium transporter n=1 Tax=Oleispira antarctica RB-8 TaxID=698738 RepID=R4YTT4_OLEAN|nr:Ammonium transporter, putative [Oleispira antarctica RB-8]
MTEDRPIKTLLFFSLTFLSTHVFASDSIVDLKLNTLWVVFAAILVFFMQAGFALLESGMSRSKNAVNVMMKNYMDVCLASLIFWLVGFGIMFGNNSSGFIGEDNFALSFALIDTAPWDYTLLLFQTMFAATAVTICSGAMAERTKYNAYLVAACIIIAIIYPIFGSWVWGGFYGGSGWLADMGFIDFAGSTVVHSIGAWCALAGIIILGPRLGRFDPETGEAREIPGHNLSLVALGGFILWLGWFGFNGGSTLKADSSIGLIVLNTQLAASAGALGALISSRLAGSPVLLTSTINGSIAGLVGITAGCATMSPGFAIITGFIAGAISIWGAKGLLKMKLDDVVGAIPVHGFAGIWGTLAAGLFITGDLFNWDQALIQLLGITVAFFWAFPSALLIFYVIDKTIGLRASSQHEQQGLDFTEHDEVGYPEFNQSVTYHKGAL